MKSKTVLLVLLCTIFAVEFNCQDVSPERIRMNWFTVHMNQSCTTNPQWLNVVIDDVTVLQCSIRCMTGACVAFTYRDGRCSFLNSDVPDYWMVNFPAGKCVVKNTTASTSGKCHQNQINIHKW